MSLELVGLCCVLTALEMIAAIFAARSGWPWLLAGLVTFAGLYVVYKYSLSASSLTVVTIGWIFTSQIAAVCVDKWYFGVELNKFQYIGMGIILFGVLVMCIPSDTKVPLWSSMKSSTQSTPSSSQFQQSLRS
jgi:drug/metabolite transporter (DMT)-like permease